MSDIYCVFNFSSNILLLLYDDDIVMLGKSRKHIKILSLLKENFDLKVLDETRRLLKVEFEENKRGSQLTYRTIN